MLDNTHSAARKSMEQPDNDLPKTTDDSDKISPPKNLSDMPLYVVGLIIERSDYKEQLILRKVSKSLRSLVDQQKPACTSITDCRFGNDIWLYFNNRNVLYTSERAYKFLFSKGIDVIVLRERPEKIAFNGLTSTLNHPKLHLKDFKLYYHILEDKQKIEKHFENIRHVLESLNHQLSVEKLTIKVFNSRSLLSILPYLKPGVLKKISLRFDRNEFDWSGDSAEMDQIASLAQWKQAEELQLFEAFDRFPMKYAAHFKRFKIHEEELDGDMFVRIRDYLSKLDNFEHCDLIHDVTFYPFDFAGFLRTMAVASSDSKVFRYPIPDSEYYLEFKISTKLNCIGIEKKKLSNS